MSYEALVLNVLIASPGDTGDARDAVESVIRQWNTDRAQAERVVLLPLRWEVDGISDVGWSDGQSVLNRDLVDQCDILVGLFHSRLGSPTARAESGTVEEIERAIARSTKVHVYFSAMPVPNDVDLDQLAAVRKFRSDLGKRGLLGSFNSEVDLVRQVRTALERDVSMLSSPRSATHVAIPQAKLLATYGVDIVDVRDTSGSIESEVRNCRLHIENVGSVPAFDVQLTVDPLGSGSAPLISMAELPITIAPGGAYDFPLHLALGTARNWTVTIRWSEGENDHCNVFQVIARR